MPEDAQDVVQAAFEKMWKHREEVKTATAKSYLFTVAYHQMIDHIRKNQRIVSMSDFDESASVMHVRQAGFKKELEKATCQSRRW